MILKNIELETDKILKTVGIKSVPIPVEEIASYMKIKISRAPSKDFSGILIRKDGSALIGVNSKECFERQRFTIAHEIGHFNLHPQKDTFVDYRNNVRNLKEIQANSFAAALLMPARFLIKDFRNVSKGLNDYEVCAILSKRYEVSEDAMKIRLKDLGLRFSI